MGNFVRAYVRWVEAVNYRVGRITMYVLYAMMAILIIYYGIEVGTRMLAQLACWAQVGAKWAAWVLIIAVMPVFIIGTYNIYTRTYHKMLETLRELAGRALGLNNREALEAVNDVRGEFQSKYTFISFIWSLQTASVAVLALIVFFGVGRAYVAGLDTAGRRELVDNVLPWPVYVVVDATIDFLAVDAEGTTFRGFDWRLSCPADMAVAWLNSSRLSAACHSSPCGGGPECPRIDQVV